MNIWSLLGIEPTDEVVLIKRAYASRLKFFHPEEDPEGFQQLREAYEIALKRAKNRQNREEAAAEPVMTWEMDELPPDSEEFNEWEESEAQFPTRVMNSPFALAGEFLQQATEIYDDIYTRIDVNQWRALLEDERFTGIETRQLLQVELLRLFRDRALAPGPVWRLLDDAFAWSDMELELNQILSQQYMDYISTQLGGYWDLGYRFLENHAGSAEEIDHFLTLRIYAQQALSIDDLDNAGSFLQEASKMIPGDPDLNRMLGEYWRRTGHWEEALQVYRSMQTSGEDKTLYSLDLAYAQLQLGQYEEACSSFEDILTHTPDHPEALAGMAQCLEKLNRDIEALVLYFRINKLCPWDVYAHTRLLVLNQRLERVLNHPEDEAEIGPGQIKALQELVELYAEQEQYQYGIAVIRYLEKLEDLTARQIYQLAYALHQLERYDEAALYYKAAVEEAEGGLAFWIELLYQSGEQAFHQMDDDEALKQFERVLELDPVHTDSLYHKALLLNRAGRLEEAVLFYKQALEQEDQPMYHAGLGSCYFDLEQNKESVFHYEQAELDDSSNDAHYVKYAISLRMMGRYSEALQISNVALERDVYPYVYFNKAVAHYWLKEFEHSRENARLFLEHIDDDAQFNANFFIGTSSMFLRDWDTAVTAFAEMIKHLADDVDRRIFFKLYAASLLAARRFNEAMEPLEQVLRLEEHNEWAMVQLIRVHTELQNWNRMDGLLVRYFETVEEDARNPYVWFYGGIYLYYTDDYKRAVNFFARAYQEGLRGDTCSYYSLVLHNLKEYQEAIFMAREALEHRPGNSDYKERLRYMEEQMNKRKSIFGRIGLYNAVYTKPMMYYLDFPDVFGDKQLRNEFPEVVIEK